MAVSGTYGGQKGSPRSEGTEGVNSFKENDVYLCRRISSTIGSRMSKEC